MRYPKRPLLPGNSINYNIGQTRFHKSHQLDFVVPGVPYISEKSLPGIGGAILPGTQSEDRRPSVYALGEVTKLPPWLAFDKHVLAFDAYYIENVAGNTEYNMIVHRCKIYFYLEDGSIKVLEPKDPFHEGMTNGCIIYRQRIKYPGSEDFYDILDFNIGNEVELYGKVFKLIDCDEFTRKFLNRLGIGVPDKQFPPEDPLAKIIKEKKKKPIKPTLDRKITLREYLADDNRKLVFFGYWDDRTSNNGFVHLLLVLYFLKDDAIEIKDVTDKENIINVFKRGKLSMDLAQGLGGPGSKEPKVVLNAIGGEDKPLRTILDPLNIGKDKGPYYTDKNLTVGTVMGVLGRKIVLYDCDDFTRQYYKERYGIERQDPIERPPTKQEESAKHVKPIEMKIPPYNGFGSYEDSLINCLNLHPDNLVKPYTQFLEKDRYGYDSKILRFIAKKLIKDKLTESTFTISYYLKDDEIAVYEHYRRNSGTNCGMFIKKRKILKPGERQVLTRQPESYLANDLFIGSTVCFEDNCFHLISSDEYTLRYMETHPNEFPKSNIQIVTSKVKEAIKPIYKQFVATFLVNYVIPPARYDKFRDAILAVMGNKITEHEILTIARYYAIDLAEQEKFSFERLRRFTHDTLRKNLYDDFDRLRECFLHFDSKKQGYVSKDVAYKILRACRLPLDVEHVRVITEKFSKGEKCEIVYDELIHFLNYLQEPLSRHIEPINIPASMAWLELCRPTPKSQVSYVDIDRLIKYFDLEKGLENQTK